MVAKLSKEKHLRNSNIELLRMISMFLIVVGHFVWQTHWNFTDVSVFSKTSLQFLWFGGKLGVDLFVLISSYFLSQSTYKKKALKKLWSQVFFYSFSLFLILHFIFKVPMSMKAYANSFFPIITGTYWFATAYFVMYILMPYLNSFLDGLDKKSFRWLLILFIGICGIAVVFQTSSIGFIGDDTASLIVIYFFGAYVRKYKADFIKIDFKVYYSLLVLYLMIMYVSSFVINEWLELQGMQNDLFKFARLYYPTSPVQLLGAISLFVIFLKIPTKNNKIINSMASHVFGVYLLHCHPLVIGILWGTWVNASRYQNSLFVYVYCVIISTIIFVSAIIYDYIRECLANIIVLLKNAFFNSVNK